MQDTQERTSSNTIDTTKQLARNITFELIKACLFKVQSLASAALAPASDKEPSKYDDLVHLLNQLERKNVPTNLKFIHSAAKISNHSMDMAIHSYIGENKQYFYGSDGIEKLKASIDNDFLSKINASSKPTAHAKISKAVSNFARSSYTSSFISKVKEAGKSVRESFIQL